MTNEELRERYNPEGSLLRRQQTRMLEILLEVDRICQKHDIRYWLSSGTLIGALRHDGFIPWDDDLDIEMMREDYLRLMEVLPQELPDWLALQNDDTDPNYFYFYAKVRDRRSRMLEQNGYDRLWREQGIYIDIFPMEPHPIWMQRLSEKTVGHMYKIWRTSTDDAKAIKQVRRIFNFNKRIVFPCLRCLLSILSPLTSPHSPLKTITSAMGRSSGGRFTPASPAFTGRQLLRGKADMLPFASITADPTSAGSSMPQARMPSRASARERQSLRISFSSNTPPLTMAVGRPESRARTRSLRRLMSVTAPCMMSSAMGGRRPSHRGVSRSDMGVEERLAMNSVTTSS